MPPPPTSNLRVVKYAQGWGYAASEWERALGAIDWTKPHAEGGPERLKIKTLADGTKDATVWRATLTLGKREHEVVLKVEPLDSLRKKIQALLRQTKSFRQWRGADAIESRGFRAARAHAVLRERGVEILVIESLCGPNVLEAVADSAWRIRDQLQLADALGDWTSALCHAGIYNRDHKPSNVIVLREPAVTLALVDTVDVDVLSKIGRFLETDSELDLADMLAKLYIEAKGAGHAPRRALWVRVLRSAWLAAYGKDKRAEQHVSWREDRGEVLASIRGLSRSVARHGDPTPKDDPLERG